MFGFGKRLKGRVNKCHTFIALLMAGIAPIGSKASVLLMIPWLNAMILVSSTKKAKIIFAIVKIILDFYKKL